MLRLLLLLLLFLIIVLKSCCNSYMMDHFTVQNYYSWSLIKFLTFIIIVITQTKKSKLFNSCRQHAQPPTGFQFPRETLNLLWPTKQFLLEN